MATTENTNLRRNPAIIELVTLCGALSRRVVQLEKKIAKLERIVDDLEADIHEHFGAKW